MVIEHEVLVRGKRFWSLGMLFVLCTIVAGCYLPYPHWRNEKPLIHGYIAVDRLSSGIYGERSPLSKPLSGMRVWQANPRVDACSTEACAWDEAEVVTTDAEGRFLLTPLRGQFRYGMVVLPTSLEYSLDLCLCFQGEEEMVYPVRSIELLSERYPTEVEVVCEKVEAEITCECCLFAQSKFAEILAP